MGAAGGERAGAPTIDGTFHYMSSFSLLLWIYFGCNSFWVICQFYSFIGLYLTSIHSPDRMTLIFTRKVKKSGNRNLSSDMSDSRKFLIFYTFSLFYSLTFDINTTVSQCVEAVKQIPERQTSALVELSILLWSALLREFSSIWFYLTQYAQSYPYFLILSLSCLSFGR